MKYSETYARTNAERPPFTVRWPSPDHLAEVERFASSLGESLSLFLRRSALERMERQREQASR